MHDEIRNIIIKTAKAVNALQSTDCEANRIKYAKFRGMIISYEMITLEEVKYIKFLDKDDMTYRIKKIIFENYEITL